MQTKRENYVIIFLAVLIVVFSGLWLSFRMTHVKLLNESNQQQTALTKAKKDYKSHVADVQESLIKHSSNSNDTTIKAISLQNNTQASLDNVSSQFFKVYYSWNSNSDYSKRATKLSGLISNDLKNNKTVFDSGKDSTGHGYIDALGLSSQYQGSKAQIEDVSGNVVKGLVKVTFSGKFSSSDADDGDNRNGYKVYEVTYDLNQQKITNINALIGGMDS